MFQLQGVSKRFGSETALAAIDLDLERGKTHVLIGPSGCGKTTLLRLMLRLVEPDAGVVMFDGHPMATDDQAEFRHRVGYVVQQGGLFPHLTARENVLLVPSYLKWSGERCASRLDELLELARLPTAAIDRYPAQLSGGQRQRVSLMRALMLEPDALLLDEPLGALDPMIRAELQDDLRSIFRSLHKTVVMVTHDLAEAGYFADTVTLLREGQIVQHGPFEDLLARPADEFVSRFVTAQRHEWLESRP